MSSAFDQEVALKQILEAVKSLKQDQNQLASSVDAINGRVNVLAGVKKALDNGAASEPEAVVPLEEAKQENHVAQSPSLTASILGTSPGTPSALPTPARRTGHFGITTHPGRVGVNPLPMDWGNADVQKRGPVVVSRYHDSIGRRNAMGAHSGSYSTYYALAIASGALPLEYKPNFENAEPAVDIGPFKAWSDKKKIVAMDPWGHLAPWVFKDTMAKNNVDIKPTIAITRAHMKLPELEKSVSEGRLVPDGKICLNESGELAVTKFAVEPVWYLPGVAERFNIDEQHLRDALFEHTGGSYPELRTRPDLKVFLPPIGGLTVYCFGDPAKMSDESCNGSDVFGSDICTCRPYLIYGIEEAVKEAQKGGSGVVIYFRKEGRALGEVTKYLVYNARKRGGDKASEYFQRTENVAGVKDMRFQALMPDILHWLGIKKIDRMLSMSDMKHDAIVGQGIPIIERVELPDSWIPEDSRVEIDAKIAQGYFTNGHVMTTEELEKVQGRTWDDIDH